MEGGTCDAVGLGASAVRAGPATASSANSCAPHRDLVRSVALGEHFVLSGSYDLSIKVRRLSLDVVLISVLHEVLRRLTASIFRCGTATRVHLLLILKEVIRAGYSVLALIVPR